MVKVKGLKASKHETVKLDKFFDTPASVEIRPLSVVARAKVQELTTNGMRYATTMSKKRGLDIDAIEQAMPSEMTLEIRRVKLEDGVVKHEFRGENGEPLAWGPELWDAVDEVNPDVLGFIVERINELTYPDDEEEGADPTSPGRSGKK